MNEASSSSLPASSSSLPEKTEILYGNDNIQRVVLEAYSQIKEQHDSCMDHTEVAMAVTYDAIWNGILDLKKRGIKIRCIVEATPEISFIARNLCKSRKSDISLQQEVILVYLTENNVCSIQLQMSNNRYLMP